MVAAHDCRGLNNFINVLQVQGWKDNNGSFITVVFSQLSALIAA